MLLAPYRRFSYWPFFSFSFSLLMLLLLWGELCREIIHANTYPVVLQMIRLWDFIVYELKQFQKFELTWHNSIYGVWYGTTPQRYSYRTLYQSSSSGALRTRVQHHLSLWQHEISCRLWTHPAWTPLVIRPKFWSYDQFREWASSQIFNARALFTWINPVSRVPDGVNHELHER